MAELAVTADAPARRPYWQSADLDALWRPADLPARAETIVVGAGATGISAARELSRRGREVLLLDAGEAPGTSLANGGFVGDQLRHHPLTRLAESLGLDKAVALYREAHRAYDYVREVIQSETIDCAYGETGRITLLETPAARDALLADLELKRRHLGQTYEVVPPDALPGEVAAPNHVGGILLPGSASLDPARFLGGQLARAVSRGARFSAATEVRAIRAVPAGYAVETARGTVAARQVIVAVNGADRRALAAPLRLVPLPGHMMAVRLAGTPPVNPSHPGRTYNEAKTIFAFFRLTPDGKSLVFGAGTGMQPDDGDAITRCLLADLARVLPGTRGEVTHVWSGVCAEAPPRLLPAVRRDGGLLMAGGYHLGGMSMATWCGRLMAALASGENPESGFGPLPVN
jgi:glycine/D-amino acid oxidase-like deaminating enzyme